MLRSAIPTRFQKAWGASAAGAYIRTVPVNSQIGIQDGAASFETGWVPDNFTPLAAGGVPPFGQDFNGLENAATSWDIWYQARAPIAYDATFATAVGGYPQGAVLDSAVVLGKQWLSLVDSNLTNPDDPLTSVGWEAQGLPSGTLVPFLTATLPSGFVIMNALTIGNAASNATGLAAASALFLFAANWFQFSNTQCPIFTSAGAPSTRGANPYADFAANKQLQLPSGKAITLAGADTMGGAATTFYSGVPITVGNTTTPGSVLGENLHALISSENGTHTHFSSLSDPTHNHTTNFSDPTHQHNISPATVSFGGGPSGVTAAGVSAAATLSATVTGFAATGVVISNNGSATGITLNNAASGSSVGHNTVQRSMIVYWGQKL